MLIPNFPMCKQYLVMYEICPFNCGDSGIFVLLFILFCFLFLDPLLCTMALCYDISLNYHPGSHDSDEREGERLAIRYKIL